jgi:phenylpropionate dioxygenase-like ring-hydroxylating dioxygenase large terminal subunit
MKYLKNTWYVALWSTDLVQGSLVARTVIETPLVLFRRADGSPAALLDRCPHRFAPLSQGKLCEGDHVQCPYHGLRFNSQGTCIANPHSDRIPASARTASFPAVERHSLVWVWMGDLPADEGLIPDYSVLDGPLEVTRRETIELKVNYRLMTDNLLDLSHVSFLHDGILGHDEMISGTTNVVEEAEGLFVKRSTPNVKPPGMFDLVYQRDGRPVDLWADMRWNAPSHLLNYTGVCPPGGKRDEGVALFGVHILTPVSELATSYHIAAAIVVPPRLRPPAEEWDDVMRKLADLRRHAFEQQDEPMVLAQQNAQLAAGGLDVLNPVLLNIDAGPVRARRFLDRLITAEAERVARTA